VFIFEVLPGSYTTRIGRTRVQEEEEEKRPLACFQRYHVTLLHFTSVYSNKLDFSDADPYYVTSQN